MTVFPFAELARGLYRAEDCITTHHFRTQADLRGFTRADLETLLLEGFWNPDDEHDDCWSVQADRWAIVVHIEDEAPVLITPKFRAEFVRATL